MNSLTVWLEICSFILALWHNNLLAHKHRHAWWAYVIFSVVSVSLFSIQSSFITVINQAYSWLSAIYPWISQKKDLKFQKYFNWGAWCIFIVSLWLFRANNLWDWFEVSAWVFIILKNGLTRSEKSIWWIYMIFQTLLSIVFNILRLNFILALRNTIQFWQAIYGYRKWRLPPN